MGEKKVSVVVATYNQEKYIRHTLESIFSQKINFEMEVIVGDDCSTDGNANIIREFAEKYPDIMVPVIREKNLGMYGNEADLLTRVHGEYVAFVEGDDYWIDDNKLQKQVEFMDSHPDCVACFGLCQIVNENEERQIEAEKYTNYKKEAGEYTIKDYEKYIFPGQTATSMYRKSAYGKILAKVKGSEFEPRKMLDVIQILCMLSVGKIYTLGEYFAAYRYMMNTDSGSWSSQNDSYNKVNLFKYLDGMKEMERLAAFLGLELNFDNIRLYELNKLEDSAACFEKKDYSDIYNRLLQDSFDKNDLKKTHIKRVIKRAVKGIARNVLKVFKLR